MNRLEIIFNQKQPSKKKVKKLLEFKLENLKVGQIWKTKGMVTPYILPKGTFKLTSISLYNVNWEWITGGFKPRDNPYSDGLEIDNVQKYYNPTLVS